MKDSIYLLLTGLACAFAAWLFFNALQSYAFLVIGAVAIVSIATRLFKKQRSSE